MWSASQICMSSLCWGHANLLCIIQSQYILAEARTFFMSLDNMTDFCPANVYLYPSPPLLLFCLFDYAFFLFHLNCSCTVEICHPPSFLCIQYCGQSHLLQQPWLLASSLWIMTTWPYPVLTSFQHCIPDSRLLLGMPIYII